MAGSDIGNLGLRVNPIRDDAGLGASERNGFPSEGIDGHGGERNRRLLASGQKDVHLSLGRLSGNIASQFNETIGDSRHRRDNDHNRVSLLLRGDHATGDVEDSFGCADGCAAVFLNDQCHEKRVSFCPAPHERRSMSHPTRME